MTQTPDGDVYLVRDGRSEPVDIGLVEDLYTRSVRSFNEAVARAPGSHGPGWNLVAGGCAAAQEFASATTVTLDVPELPGT